MVDPREFDRIFGPRDPERRAGVQYLCRSCGGWHVYGETPHNCMEPDWRPPQRLAAPMVMPDVPEHSPQRGVVIGTRHEQREYMRRNGLVEHDDFKETAGNHRLKEAMRMRDYEEELVEDIKRAMEEDPLSRPPPEMIEEANSHVSDEEQVSMEAVEIVDENSSPP